MKAIEFYINGGLTNIFPNETENDQKLIERYEKIVLQQDPTRKITKVEITL
jgi:hypothetical protein